MVEMCRGVGGRDTPSTARGSLAEMRGDLSVAGESSKQDCKYLVSFVMAHMSLYILVLFTSLYIPVLCTY